MDHKYYAIRSSCSIIKGEYLSVIIDHHLKKLFKISNNTFNKIDSSLVNKESILLSGLYYHKSIEEILIFFIKNNLVFPTNDPQLYYKPSLEYKTPSIIEHVLIEIYDFNLFDYYSLFKKLEKLSCHTIEAWITGKYHSNYLNNFLDSFKESSIKNIIVYIDENIITPYSIELFEKLYIKNKKILNIIIYSSRYNKRYSNLFCVKENLYLNLFKETYKQNLYLNYSFFIESKHYNPFYYKKASISRIGEIKNSLFLEKSFGNIRNIQQIVQSNDFQELWYVNNDKIIGIKDSPLRYSIMISNEIQKQENGFYSIKRLNNKNPFSWEIFNSI